MSRTSRKPGRRSSGPPPVVVGLLVVELVVVAVLLAFGVSPSDVLRSAGPLFALTLALLNPTVQEFGRRQAKLSVVADEANNDGLVTAPALAPWPIEADRVVANELAAARETLSWSGDAMNFLLRATDPFAVMPTDADHARARDAFEQQLSDFETSLRDWLNEYATAAAECSRTFDLTLRVTNARSGAHADAVTIILDLPATVRLADTRPDVMLPPEHPRYEPPRPRSRRADSWLHEAGVVPLAKPIFPWSVPQTPLPKRAWRNAEDGRHLEVAVGEVHSGRSVSVGEPLLLLADRTGQHEIHWTASYQERSAGCRGNDHPLRSAQPTRPTGIRPPARHRELPGRADRRRRRVIHPVRVVDPPLQPPAIEDSSDVLGSIQQAVAFREWNALGLDPAADGPDRSEVVRAARPAAQHADD